MKSLSFASRVPVRAIAAAVIATTALSWQAAAQAQAAPPNPLTQSSAERSVTVVVTPKPASQGAAEWEFAVKLDTHSASLDDDLTKSAVLIADGREILPSGWSGAGPGSHHREGVLKFPAPAKPPAAVELRIQRDNEPSPRVYRWDGAALH
jgi:hypothetical protein